jgi:hypothetical protein
VVFFAVAALRVAGFAIAAVVRFVAAPVRFAAAGLRPGAFAARVDVVFFAAAAALRVPVVRDAAPRVAPPRVDARRVDARTAIAWLRGRSVVVVSSVLIRKTPYIVVTG